MQIYNGSGATLLPPSSPPPPIELPLWVVLGRSDLHDLFLQFATQVFNGAAITDATLDFDSQAGNPSPPTSGLCRLIYYNWLTHFVTCTTASSTYNSTVNGNPAPPVTDPASFISLVRKVLADFPRCRLYVLLGIYHFVIWCLSKQTTAAGNIDTSVTDYIQQELCKHIYADPKGDYQVIWAPPAIYPPVFANAFKPTNSLQQFEFGMRSILPCLEFKSSRERLPDSTSFHSAESAVKYASRAALCSFIRKARRLLADTVHEEALAVLDAIDSTLQADYLRTKVLALGDGSPSLGFFGKANLGVLFFDYELAGVASNIDFDSDGKSSDSLVYLGIQTSAALEISGGDASSLFIAHIGMDQTFNAEFSSTTNAEPPNAFIPHVLTRKFGISDPLSSHETLYAVHNGTSRLESRGPASIYNSSDSSISLEEAECTRVYCSTNQESSKAAEEIAFIIMPNNVPPLPPDATASTYWQLPDNEFYDASKIANLFQGNPSNSGDLDEVLDELVLTSDFVVRAMLRGQGIGAILDAAESPSSWENIAEASQQTDLPKYKTQPVDNDQKRHARGTMSVFSNGEYHLFKIDVVGFASPVRCTWATKYPYYAKMRASVGDYVANYDTDTAGGPWYNGALSSFRAFGLLKGMIEALKAHVAARIAGSSPAMVLTLNGIVSKLDTFLATEAEVRIRARSDRWVQKGGNDLIINNAMFIDVTTP